MKINGRTKSGKPRVLECSPDGNDLHLWIHSPESTNNGWEIWIPAEAAARLSAHVCGKTKSQKHLL